MTAKLHRSFPSRARFLADAVRRLSDREVELDLPGRRALPTGSLVDLDLRLDDGSPLLVGTGMVTRGVGEGVEAPFRVRFLGLTDPSRAALEELVAEAARAQADVTQPSEPSGKGRSPESLEDLVAGAFGDRKPPPAAPVPAPELRAKPAPEPEPFPALAAPPVELPDAEPEEGDEDEPPRRRSLLERLQVSPAVIVVALVAGGVAAETGPAPAAAGDAPPGAAAGASGGEVSGAAAAADLGAGPADRVRLITWDKRPSETVVTFWGNGAFLPERVVRHRLPGGTPRELLKLRGIDLPYRETVLAVGTPELVRIRTGFHPQDRVNELHVVLDLAAPGVELARTEGTGNSFSVHLRAAGGQ